jgi:phenylpropionate dioxygenase-like ring-hydroxylating dioxygenase large terminal subunit
VPPLRYYSSLNSQPAPRDALGEETVKNKKSVNRRDFARTTLAAGAAAVAFPEVLRAGVASEAAEGTRPAVDAFPAPAGRAAARSYPSGWREGTTIPAEYYLDPKHYHNDERFIADTFWLMVDHESRIPAAGDYFVFEYGRGESVIILRNGSGAVKAWHNVCRHRGSRLCRDSDDPKPGDPRLSVRQLSTSGNTPVFRCPYHGWTYDLDGRLIQSYRMQKDFDPAKNGLVPCHVRVAEGHIFVNLSPKDAPPDFQPTLEYYQDIARQYSFAKLKIGPRWFYPIKANWKLAIENFLECYHCGPSHKSLVTTHNWDHQLSDEQQARRDKDVASWIARQSSTAAAAKQAMGMGGPSGPTSFEGELNPGYLTGSLDGKPLAPLLPGIKDWTHKTTVAVTDWSTGYWQAYDDHVMVARFTPRDVALTDCEIFWLIHPDAVEGKDYHADKLMALWGITIQEDIWIVENNHLGITSGAYSSGRYAGHENYPADFVKWYMTEVVKA